jgi:hypothetical protein
MENRIISKRTLFVLALLGLAAVLLYFSSQILLLKAANFLAPEETGRAEAVILEGNGLIKLKAVEMGTALLSSGRANRLVAVIHQDAENGQTFALPDYPSLLAKNLEGLGLKKNQFQIIVATNDHPVTLTEAKIVLSHLARDGVKSVILLAEGFHTRRSYWAYKRVGLPLGIEIIPRPCFTSYPREVWWQDRRGVHQFIDESLKFIYYLLRGYIPLKSLFVI